MGIDSVRSGWVGLLLVRGRSLVKCSTVFLSYAVRV